MFMPCTSSFGDVPPGLLANEDVTLILADYIVSFLHRPPSVYILVVCSSWRY